MTMEKPEDHILYAKPGPHRHAFRWQTSLMINLDAGEFPTPPDDALCECGLTFGQYKEAALKEAKA